MASDIFQRSIEIFDVDYDDVPKDQALWDWLAGFVSSSPNGGTLTISHIDQLVSQLNMKKLSLGDPKKTQNPSVFEYEVFQEEGGTPFAYLLIHFIAQ